MYKNVIVPIMGNYIKEIAESTLDLIDDREVNLFIVYVVDGSVPFLTPKTIKEAMIKELKEKGRVFLDEFEEILELENHSNVKAKKLLLEGKPAEEIVKTAEKECADVIVMGTGKSIVDKHLLGSVSEEVIHFAPCTVHLVRTISDKTCSY
ncbi:universal stress protein [Methanobrevibacter filiformis]|uniref:Putative universal stress protein n=1 Tax=Methanobrevibacter filiformis TaxID=55758 RepID=A0A166A769_9EURY|nr:universal stress protein [Methanobrevibacter filiformis]KZX11656.1 putative universal stress protein [Methanobrevibacter filiformis]